ncbi:hypothetical protein Tsubulata_038051 [Turnera subulata]|uniref:Uncharacterized protein n=1 Tax=Turnera subulata TaxID=218843 RepID=A0A9Q0GDD3_9ROSI|nr:hypothetical protein Tsubulata_038051 [Turnera subulata]
MKAILKGNFFFFLTKTYQCTLMCSIWCSKKQSSKVKNLESINPTASLISHFFPCLQTSHFFFSTASIHNFYLLGPSLKISSSHFLTHFTHRSINPNLNPALNCFFFFSGFWAFCLDLIFFF